MASGGDLPLQNKLQQKEPASKPLTQDACETNGKTQNHGAGDFRDQEEEDHISKKISEVQDSALVPVKEDLSEWITRLTGVPVSTDTFMEVLDTGIVLCSIAKLIEKHAQEMAAEGKITEPLPQCRLKCNNRAKSATWFARDNCANFLRWSRAYGMPDEAQFDTEDLVSHRREKPVVNCVLELARMAVKYGIEPPSLIRMEKEIDEEARGEAVKETPVPILPPPMPSPLQAPKRTGMATDLDKEVRKLAIKCKCEDHVKRIQEGVYDIFGKRVFIRVALPKWNKSSASLASDSSLSELTCSESEMQAGLPLLHGKHLMVRVGGGWNTLENYLLHHDPIHVYEYRHSANPNCPRDDDKFLVIRSKYKSS